MLFGPLSFWVTQVGTKPIRFPTLLLVPAILRGRNVFAPSWFTFAILSSALTLLNACALLERSASRAETDTTPNSSDVALKPPAEMLPSSPLPSAELPPTEKPPEPTKWPQTGEASWYGPKFHGKNTASGDTFNQRAFTAAHPSLPFGSRVKVTNLANGKSVEVVINDRGPFAGNRIIDISLGAAKALEMKESGTTTVQIEPLSAQ
jgi:peptidoglycan lytic transglycosylase